MCTKNHNHMKYSSWDPEIQSETVILDHFWLIAPPSISLNNPENQNFEKMKKASRDVIILNLCNKKYDHMMYACSDMECDRHNFFVILGYFCYFTPLLTPKIKIWKKYKKHLEILSFYTCVPYIKIIWCMVPDI